MKSSPNFQPSVELKKYSTLGIGGPAQYFCTIQTIDEMQQAILYCHQENIPFMVLGKGSNCLFDDRGFCGAILLNKIDFCEQPLPGTFYVGAGYSFSLLGVQASRQGWGGLEFASGIPASVGGAVFMNAGANRGETCSFLTSVEYISHEGILETIKKEDISFAYRYSSFQKRQGAIVSATFTLPQDTSARQKQIEIVNMRTKTQPYNDKSAGCIFLNPECEPAGALIDRCGLKGVNVAGAKVSEKHANFLINHENATCTDMLNLIELIKAKVKEQTGIELKSEVRQISYQQEGK